MIINFILNGEEVNYDAYPGETLFELLRRYHHYEVKGIIVKLESVVPVLFLSMTNLFLLAHFLLVKLLEKK